MNKDEQTVEKFKTEGLPKAMSAAKKKYESIDYDCSDMIFQDESRFGLITRCSRVLTTRGIKPVGTSSARL